MKAKLQFKLSARIKAKLNDREVTAVAALIGPMDTEEMKQFLRKSHRFVIREEDLDRTVQTLRDIYVELDNFRKIGVEKGAMADKSLSEAFGVKEDGQTTS